MQKILTILKQLTHNQYFIIGITLFIVVAGITFLALSHRQISQLQLATPKDEITGSWEAKGTTKENYAWLVNYTYKDGRYSLKTESAFKDEGTYVISQKFEDKSIKITKTSETYKKTYDNYITLDPEGKFIVIEGMKLYKK